MNYDKLREAIEEYLRTDKSQYQVAREYDIPRSTLNDHIRRLLGYVDKDMGRRALGLPSLKAASAKSDWLSLVGSDMSGRTSEAAKPRSSDMSEAVARTSGVGQDKPSDMSGGKSGSKVPYGAIAAVAIAVISFAGFLIYLYWRWRSGSGGEDRQGPETRPPSGAQGLGATDHQPKPYIAPEEERELIEKWRREFEGY